MENLYIKNGIILSMVFILMTLVLFIANMDTEQWAKWLILGIVFICLIISLKIYAADTTNEKELTFESIFKLGILTSLVFSLTICLFMLLYVYLIDVEYYEKITNTAIEKMQQKNLPEEKIDYFIKASEVYMSAPFLLITNFFSYMLTGALGSLIGALLFRKK